MEYKVEFYKAESGMEPFIDWLESLKDMDTRALILQRLQRVALGNFGYCSPIENGLWEFRIHAGSGFRIYYSIAGKTLVLVFAGGTKRSQKKDIKQALAYLEQYKKRSK